MQIEDDLGAPEESAERWTPCRVVSNMHTQPFCSQLFQDCLQARKHRPGSPGRLTDYLSALVTVRLQIMAEGFCVACSWHVLATQWCNLGSAVVCTHRRGMLKA